MRKQTEEMAKAQTVLVWADLSLQNHNCHFTMQKCSWNKWADQMWIENTYVHNVQIQQRHNCGLWNPDPEMMPPLSWVSSQVSVLSWVSWCLTHNKIAKSFLSLSYTTWMNCIVLDIAHIRLNLFRNVNKCNNARFFVKYFLTFKNKYILQMSVKAFCAFI